MQLRLAACSAFWVGLLLTVLSLVAVNRLDKQAGDTLDKSLSAQAAWIMSMPFRPYPWDHMDKRLQQVFPSKTDDPNLVFVAQQSKPDVVYVSRSWPPDINPRALAPRLREDWLKRAAEWEPIIGRPPPARPPDEGFRDQDEELALILKPRARITETTGGATWRFNLFQDDSDMLLIGRRYDSLELHPEAFRRLSWVSVPILMLLTFLLVRFITGRALRPLDAITQSIESVTSQGLNRALDASGSDREFSHLVLVINGMLERLSGSFNRTRQLSAFAAHELKTPLTILRTKIERAIQAEEAGSERQQFLAKLMKDVSRLHQVTEQLLLLFRADSGNLELNVTEFDLAEIVRKLLEDADVLAPALKITSQIPETLVIHGDRGLLTQAVQNLVFNAVRHNRRKPAGFIHTEVVSDGRMVSLRVANSSRAIPLEQQKQVFTLFYRGDRSGSDFHGGTGLGLPLAREIARAHAGDVELLESTDEQTVFVLTVPIRAAGK